MARRQIMNDWSIRNIRNANTSNFLRSIERRKIFLMMAVKTAGMAELAILVVVTATKGQAWASAG